MILGLYVLGESSCPDEPLDGDELGCEDCGGGEDGFGCEGLLGGAERSLLGGKLSSGFVSLRSVLPLNLVSLLFLLPSLSKGLPPPPFLAINILSKWLLARLNGLPAMVDTAPDAAC
jgi:hypothetical protein